MFLPEILAANLNKLMAASPRLGTNKKIVAASSGRLSNGKIGRVRLGGTTELGTISELAQVFDLQPWQLLVEGLNPQALPELSNIQLLEQIKHLVGVTTQQPVPSKTLSRVSFVDKPVETLVRETTTEIQQWKATRLDAQRTPVSTKKAHPK